MRYRGLAKNTQRLAGLLGLGNLLTGEQWDRIPPDRRWVRPRPQWEQDQGPDIAENKPQAGYSRKLTR